jgi:hypothetical protein
MMSVSGSYGPHPSARTRNHGPLQRVAAHSISASQHRCRLPECQLPGVVLLGIWVWIKSSTAKPTASHASHRFLRCSPAAPTDHPTNAARKLHVEILLYCISRAISILFPCANRFSQPEPTAAIHFWVKSQVNHIRLFPSLSSSSSSQRFVLVSVAEAVHPQIKDAFVIS